MSNTSISIHLHLNKLGDETFIFPWLECWYDFAEYILVTNIDTADRTRYLLDKFDDVDEKIHFSTRLTPGPKSGWFASLAPYELMSVSEKKVLKQLMESGSYHSIMVDIAEFYFNIKHYCIYSWPKFFRALSEGEERESSPLKIRPVLCSYFLIGNKRVRDYLMLIGEDQYYENVWLRWMNTRSVNEALKGNMGFPRIGARWSDMFRQELRSDPISHPEVVQRRLEYFGEGDD